MKLGTFWSRPGYDYSPNAVMMDRFTCKSWVPLEEYHPDLCEERINDFLTLHPTGEVMVRCDWSWVYPQIPWLPFHLEDCADHFKEFREIVGSYIPQAKFLMTPIAPYHPDSLGAPSAPPGIEDSPWARLYYAQADKTWDVEDAWNVHVYGDPQVSDPFQTEPWTDHKKTPEGWRFAFNYARTVRQIHDSIFPGLQTVVSEFNTAARGVAPNTNYPQGWLFNAVGALAASLGDVHSALWFVGHDNGGWADYVLHDIPSLEAEFGWLKQHGW
jgi:hypothetical protein